MRFFFIMIFGEGVIDSRSESIPGVGEEKGFEGHSSPLNISHFKTCILTLVALAFGDGLFPSISSYLVGSDQEQSSSPFPKSTAHAQAYAGLTFLFPLFISLPLVLLFQ